MGAVRPAPAGDRRRCSRPRRKTRANRRTSTALRPRLTFRAARITCRRSGNVSCITAGAAYRIRGIDLGVGGKITDKWSVFGGLVLMQSEVTKSLVPSPQPLLFPTNVGLQARQRRASVVQHAEQVSAHGRLGDRRAGGVPLGDVRRNVPGGEPGHVDPELLALRYLRRKPRSTRTGRQSCSSPTSPTSSTTTRSIRARRRSCSWRRAAA